MKLTKSQIDNLKAALTMSEANGFDRPGCTGAGYRSLEVRGLMTSMVVTAATYKGGGWQKRVYRLTAEGRALAETLTQRA